MQCSTLAGRLLDIFIFLPTLKYLMYDLLTLEKLFYQLGPKAGDLFS